MGNYHTNAQLKARFPDDAAVAQLTGADTAETGVPDEDVLTEVVNGTEGIVDSYIARRYLVPVAVADHASLAAHMKSLCLDVSVYRLMKDRGIVPTAVKDARDEAIKWCEAIATGKAALPTPDSEAATESLEPRSTYDIGATGDADKQNRVFTRWTMARL